MGSNESLRLDAAAASGEISRAAAAGASAAAVGAAEGVVAGGGGSPIDAAVVVVQVQQSVLRTGFGALVAGQTAEREAGENDGVAMMEQTESQNALRLGEIGPEGAAATAPSIITI